MRNKKFITIFLSLLVFLSLSSVHGYSQVQISVKSIRFPIIYSGGGSVDNGAAYLLKRFVKEICDDDLVVYEYKGQVLHKNDIYIHSISDDDRITEDGFRINTLGGILDISGVGNGTVYGVVTLLERYLGVNYWSENEYDIIKCSIINIPALDIVENPAFRYRQSQNYALKTDPVYKAWMRLESPEEVFAGGYWVHTFDRLLPSAIYGESHPEYYSWFNGRRNPGKASQWCLTNPEVLEIVTQRLDSIFKANPGKNIISVSQNDGNYTNCTCPECKRIDDYEGALSGSLIHFMNKLAERFPDKEISTLAYLYTMKPPKHVKPLPNVNIMLCDIDCNREVTLTENESGREFVKAMEGWSAISNNIFVWDYGINFDNYLSPFPNFHILRDNIRLFLKNHATMHFSQIASVRGGDFAEMRTWLVSKLMWNPEQDTDSLMNIFLNGYYGEAGPYIYRYTKMMEGALIGSGLRLWIYDSPVSHKTGMLKPELMKRYNLIFDQAEASVAEDSLKLARVRRLRLPLQFAELDISRTEIDKDIPDIERKIDLFESRARMYGADHLNERGNTPDEYCRLYRERYLHPVSDNLAYGAKIEYIVEPTGRYAELGKTALTDGLYGGASFVESWVGWEGIDGSFIIDLGEEKNISEIETDFLHQLGQWILLPKKVDYSISTDKKEFYHAGSYDLPEDSSPQVKFVQVLHFFEEPVLARYIKIDVTGTKVCPHWHYGVGNPCWFFIDEIVVY